MKLSSAPPAYNQRDEQTVRSDLERELDRCYKQRENIDIDPNASIIMTSPNGTRYKLTVSNAGASVWTAI